MKTRKIIIISGLLILVAGFAGFKAYSTHQGRNQPEWLRVLNTYKNSNSSIAIKNNILLATTTWQNPNPESEFYKSFSIENGHVYYDKNDLLVGVSAIKFEVLDDGFHNDLNYVYVKDINALYTCSSSMGMNFTCFPQKGIDPDSFRPLTGEFSVDKDHVFYAFKIIPDADPKTFRILKWSDRDNDYSADAHNVYFRTELIAGADPANFVPINYYFSQDKKNVYCLTDVLPDVVPGINAIHAIQTANESEFGGQIIADPYNLLIIDGRVFMHCHELDIEDPSTFKNIGGEFYTDKDNVYFIQSVNVGQSNYTERADKIIGADPATFEYLGVGEGQDKNHKYSYPDNQTYPTISPR